ncbi:hypothetical protein [Fructobacillus papyrifericola]|uniref:Membrane protein 6-pyruvoyl-tetrahydropterin synthase-related domain-containing protein n=1 Tax=Fructobacillus papyrifericola TaxID=2713172 RepID=A0ABS5QRG1_9LACO|nr:hypothetical protein [Fructobacillus papyrifericola]MBS9335794.1 hypothetical protein [Fructobacillus papyrifericola]
MFSKNSTHHFFQSETLKEVYTFIGMLLFSFLLLNVLLIIPIRFNGDSFFHLSRMESIHGNPLNFLYPQNFLSLGRIGGTTNIFYPVGVLNFIVNLIPTNIGILGTYRLTVVLILYINILSMYSVLRYFIKAPLLNSFLASILWGTLIITFDIGTIGGEILAKIAFPFVAVGLYYFKKRNGWILLSFGLILSISSHILTSLFLIVFTLLYLLVEFIKTKKNKLNFVVKGMKAAIATVLGSQYIIFPMVMLYANNKINTPPQMASAFVDYQLVYLSGIITDPTFIVMAVFIILSIIYEKKYSIGILLFTLSGTTAFIWPYIFNHTILNIIQFPYRLFNWGICLAFVFAIITLSRIQIPIQWKKVVTISLLFLCFLLGTAIHKSFFSKVSNDTGYILTISKEDVIKSFQEGHDGQHLGEYGSFTGTIFNQPEVWSLMNYSDYSPSEGLNDPQTKFLFWDQKAKNIVAHRLTKNANDNIPTTHFKTTASEISFRPTKSISKSTIELPVMGYKANKVKVFINHSEIPFTIQDGRITIDAAVTAKDTVYIKQFIPLWRLIPFFVSTLTIVVLIFLILRKHLFVKSQTFWSKL